MRKRDVLLAGLAGAALPLPAARAATPVARGPVLLTIAGAIGRSNRGAPDAAADVLMLKHGAKFERAFELDGGMLGRLAAVTISPTLEYDGKPHRLRGPLLVTVVGDAGVAPDAKVALTLRALDGYNVSVSLADAQRYRMIVATSLDGVALRIGGLGPLWAVYDADRIDEFRSKPLAQRFALCPWGLYYIEVKPA